MGECAECEMSLSASLLQSLSRVVGHSHIKQGIVLGLVAKEHVYIEGPPGVAKTMLAETMAAATRLEFYFYQMHRDTRLSELIGEAVVVRSQDAETGGEIIRQQNKPGGVLTADLCVLDDISRAPGEALNVLLRILNERKLGQTPIPLRSAIATANPAGEQYYTEPLDRALLDRFTIQLKISGLLQEGAWAEVNELLSAECQPSATTAQRRNVEPIASSVLDEAWVALGQVIVPPKVQGLLIRFLKQLHEVCAHSSAAEEVLLTDRTFVVKSIKLLKAKAVLEGRDLCEPSDLLALQYMTAFRVPDAVHAAIPAMLEELAAESGDTSGL